MSETIYNLSQITGVCNKKEMKDFKCCIHFFQAFLAFALSKNPEGESIFNSKSWISHKILFACKPTCMNLHKIGSCPYGCFGLMTDSALVDAALRKSGLISNGKE